MSCLSTSSVHLSIGWLFLGRDTHWRNPFASTACLSGRSDERRPDEARLGMATARPSEERGGNHGATRREKRDDKA